MQCDHQGPRHRLPVPLLVLSPGRPAAQRARVPRHGGLRPDQFGLAELRLVNWHGWLFVDPSGQDADFATHVAGWDEVVGPYRPEDLTVVARHSYELATNWKVIAENYQECYHCSTIHPELSRISPPTSGENLELPGSWMGGWMSIVEGAETMSLTGKSGGVAIQGLSEQELRTVMYLVGYPNLLVSLHPDYVMTHLMTPLAVDRTHVECAWAFPKDVAAKPDFDPSYAVDFWDLTNRQDWAACESVQRGLSHRMRDQARSRPTRTACTSSSRGWLGHTPVPLVPRRNAVDAVDRLRIAADRERERRTHD